MEGASEECETHDAHASQAVRNTDDHESFRQEVALRDKEVWASAQVAKATIKRTGVRRRTIMSLKPLCSSPIRFSTGTLTSSNVIKVVPAHHCPDMFIRLQVTPSATERGGRESVSE